MASWFLLASLALADEKIEALHDPADLAAIADLGQDSALRLG